MLSLPGPPTISPSSRPGPPPSYNSTEFMDALGEVRNISDTRTDEQLRVSQYWADGSGTYTPPGHWNAIACDLIVEHKLDELESARALAVLNIALMDAGISCWDAGTTTGCCAPGWLIPRSPRQWAGRPFPLIPRDMQHSPVQPRLCSPAYSLPGRMISWPWPRRLPCRVSMAEFITDSITTRVSNRGG